MRKTALAVIALVGMALAQPNPMIPTDGLLARYDFTNGSLEDGSGNGRTLENFAGTSNLPELTADRDLSPNSAYHWKGSISDPWMTDDAGMPAGSADRSICAWVSLVSWDSCQYIVSWGLTRWGEPKDGSFSLAFLYDSIAVLQGDTRLGGVRVAHSEIPADGSYDEPWAHVAVTIEGTTAKFFIGGSLKGTVTIPELATATDNTKLMVGGSLGHNIDAKMDEILIYDRALTDNEVLNVYEPQVGISKSASRIVHMTPARSVAGYYDLSGRRMARRPDGEFAVRYLRR